MTLSRNRTRFPGNLADPADIPYDENHLDEPDTLTAAIDDLRQRKPHLGSRKLIGDVGQGITGVNKPSVGLVAILRGKAH